MPNTTPCNTVADRYDIKKLEKDIYIYNEKGHYGYLMWHRDNNEGQDPDPEKLEMVINASQKSAYKRCSNFFSNIFTAIS